MTKITQTIYLADPFEFPSLGLKDGKDWIIVLIGEVNNE